MISLAASLLFSEVVGMVMLQRETGLLFSSLRQVVCTGSEVEVERLQYSAMRNISVLYVPQLASAGASSNKYCKELEGKFTEWSILLV